MKAQTRSFASSLIGVVTLLAVTACNGSSSAVHGQQSSSPVDSQTPTSSDEVTQPLSRRQPPSENNEVRLGTAFKRTGPYTLDFGDVEVAQSMEKTVTVTNPADGEVRVNSISVKTVQPSGSADFELSFNDCNGILGPQQSCTFGIVFKPSGLGARTGTMEIDATTRASTPKLVGQGI